MHGFLKKKIKGFSFTINKSYADVVEESFLDDLIEDACRYALKARNGNLPKENRLLSNGRSVYIKFWKPRRVLHHIKTIWHPTRIEIEGRQYPQFIKTKLPIPDIVLWGSQRIPLSKFGIFKVGMVVTRLIKRGENLSVLYKQKKQPWIVRNYHQRLEVLEKVAQLLYSIHEENLVHGDYMLKNIVFTPSKQNGKYWIIDLASGWSLASDKSLSSSDRNHDLLRMLYSLARNGFPQEDALHFLRTYSRHWQGDNQSHNMTKKCLEIYGAPQLLGFAKNTIPGNLINR